MAGWMLYVHALSPLHSGTGSATGVIDLPVARERVTSWPYLPGSSLKGVLRDGAEAGVAALPAENRQNGDKAIKAIFGPDTRNADDGAGAIWFADAHLLCLPVRSFKGTFAWVTCRLALERWQRDRRALDPTSAITLPDAPNTGTALLAKQGTLDYTEGGRSTIALEDIDFAVQATSANTVSPALAAAEAIADALFPTSPADDWWHTSFQERFVVVDDDTFTQLALTATEVVARIRLNDESKTVAAGALWYEEAVPAEAIFTAPIGIDPRRANNEPDFRRILSPMINARTHQIGGHAGTGRGIVRLHLT